MKRSMSKQSKARMTHAEWDRLQHIRLRFLMPGSPDTDDDASPDEAISFLLDLITKGRIHPPDTLDVNDQNARLRAHVRRNQLPLPLGR